jgi:hypothetical protein
MALRPERGNKVTFYDQNVDRKGKILRGQFGEKHDHNSARNSDQSAAIPAGTVRALA